MRPVSGIPLAANSMSPDWSLLDRAAGCCGKSLFTLTGPAVPPPERLRPRPRLLFCSVTRNVLSESSKHFQCARETPLNTGDTSSRECPAYLCFARLSPNPLAFRSCRRDTKSRVAEAGRANCKLNRIPRKPKLPI